jgi:hypothetical protein
VRALLTDESPRRLLFASRPEDAALAVAALARSELTAKAFILERSRDLHDRGHADGRG